jgi:hypothetical protein
LDPSSAVVAELQEQLLARERELDSREGAIVTWEESLLVSARTLREASAESDATRALMATTRRDYLAQIGTFGSRSDDAKPFIRGWMSAPPYWGCRRWI